jgi:hypothetical protein
MDPNKIFNLFNEDLPNDDETSLLIDFSEHPFYWIGGFNKIISNHLFFTNYTARVFKNISPELNIEDVEKAGEHLMFEKAWDYIKSIKLDNLFHIECIGKKISPEFEENLQVALVFFESTEEYEKCALLKGIKDKIKELST